MLWIRNRDYSHPARMASRSGNLPAGNAAVFLWNAAPRLLTSSADTCRTPGGRITRFPSPWLSAGANEIGSQMATFFRRFKENGGRLDFLAVDYENGLSTWQISLKDMEAIERDPRSHLLIRKLGFPYLSSAFLPGPNRRAWNLMMGSRVAKALSLAFFQPAANVFPNLSGSNFGGVDLLPPHIVPDVNGHYQALSCTVGNCQSPAFYGKIGGLAYTEKDGYPYGESAFAVLRYEIMYLQGIQQSSNLPVVPWVAYRGYAKTRGYYRELIYQLVMRGANRLLYWNPRGLEGASAADDRYLSACIAALRRRLGNTPGVPIAVGGPVLWNSNLLIAARKCSNGEILFRVTVPPGTKKVLVTPEGISLDLSGKTGAWFSTKSALSIGFKALQ
jgi:hypothetical protein